MMNAFRGSFMSATLTVLIFNYIYCVLCYYSYYHQYNLFCCKLNSKLCYICVLKTTPEVISVPFHDNRLHTYMVI